MEDGLRVIDILANHPATAKFIATNWRGDSSPTIHRRLSSTKPPHVFQQSAGDIATVLRAIIDSPEFFSRRDLSEQSEETAGIRRQRAAHHRSRNQITHHLLRYLGRMGEPLFLAQPPTGHPDVAASWTSPDMLLTRMNFATDLIANRIPGSRIQKDTVGARRQ